MCDLLRMVDEISGKNLTKLDALIGPLDASFGINAFAYYQIHSNGQVAYIGNLPEISEYYFANELYKTSPFLKHPDLVQPGYYLSNAMQGDGYQNAQDLIMNKSGLNNLLLIVEKEKDVLHAYGMGSTKKNLNLTNLYLNNLQTLAGYCHHFRESTRDILKKTNDFTVNIVKLIGHDFYSGSSKRDISIGDEVKIQLLDHLKLFGPGDARIVPLSQREIECLELILQGKSSTIIGRKLNLSPRTIEHYTESIKNKLGCSSKTEIFELVELLRTYGYHFSIFSQPICAQHQR